VSLFDDYILTLANYQKKGKLRRLINSDHTHLRNYLSETVNKLTSIKTVHHLKEGLKLYDRIVALEKESGKELDEEDLFLNQVIDQSYTYANIKKVTSCKAYLKNKACKLFTGLADALNTLANSSLYAVSRIAGNSVGILQSRHGKLYRISDGEEEEIASQLQPLDILFEKTPFRLTDKFIPGYWGHVAIWVGGKRDLQELGVWIIRR